MVDLGCGDLGVLAPLLRRLPLGSYLGLDLSAPVLPRAAAALGPVPYPAAWRIGDLLAWAEAEPSGVPAHGRGEPSVDLLHSAFAVHHLTDDDKARFLRLCRRRLAPGGILLWADVFRESGESREDYVARYVQRIRNGWDALQPEQRQQVIDHLSQFDIPADRDAIQRTAEVNGWRWQWLWQGTHRAEALAMLTPAG
jgi:SAM-dependent methyltransferase